jgi:hypothetical protein
MARLRTDQGQRVHPPSVTDALEERVASAAGICNVGHGRLVEAAADAIRDGLWQGWRIHTPVQWLMWKAGLSRHTARQVVRLAVRSPELPTTLRLPSEGRLSLDQASAVARYAPAEYEASVCELAVNATVPQIVTATRRYAFDADAPVGASRPARAPSREVAFGSDDDGRWWARISLAADEGAVVEEALTTACDRLHRTVRRAAVERAAAEGRPTRGTDAELGVARIGWADALVGMAHSVLGTNAASATTGARPTVHLHLEKPGPGCGEAWRAELHCGPPLPTWLRRYLLCDCDVELAWTDDGIPVSTTRHHRTPPRRIRRLIEKRDGYRCRVPGCDSTLWLQVHHVVHWEDDGETVTWNLCCLCAHHHRLHHQGFLGITGNADRPDGLTFSDRHGLVLDPAGHPRAPTPAEIAALATPARYDGPTGERLWRDAVAFNRRWYRERRPAA